MASSPHRYFPLDWAEDFTGGELGRREDRNSPREKRKGSKPILPPGGTSEMSHSAMLLMDTAKDTQSSLTDCKGAINNSMFT